MIFLCHNMVCRFIGIVVNMTIFNSSNFNGDKLTKCYENVKSPNLITVIQ